ncbi:MAG: hypothetical protein HKN35_00230 [Woeseia sp.]|nr:hypothetical protein [Woeseia sp.]NNE59305.1 hypothetical protein [Woeseia sp.]NNL54565.1 hypothetical protein [Woeseia sp.]
MTVDHETATNVNAQRLVVFADWNHWVPQLIIGELLPLLEKRDQLQLVGMCLPNSTMHAKRILRHCSSRILDWCKNPSRHHQIPAPVDPQQLAQRFGFELFTSENEIRLETTLDRLKPDILVSIFWKRKFTEKFLDRFKQAINYHNGTTPDYRGLRATAWSVYNNEISSGFTIHRVNDGLDCGNVLATHSVPIEPRDSVFDVEFRKTQRAIKCLPDILDAMENNFEGIPQTQLHKYNRVQSIERLCTIEHPDTLSSDEILRRIRAFGSVRVRHMQRDLWLSGLADRLPSGTDSARHALNLADGSWTIGRSDSVRARVESIWSWFSRASSKRENA